MSQTTPNTVDALPATFDEWARSKGFKLQGYSSDNVDTLRECWEASARALAAMPASIDERVLEKMVDAFQKYQLPCDRGYAQVEEGMRLALVAGGFLTADAEVLNAPTVGPPEPPTQQAGGVPAGCPPHAEIYVGSGKFAICDWADWPAVRAFNWKLTTKTNSGCQYAQAWDSHDSETRNRVTMHRLIFRAPDGMVVDHINGDGLDNRRLNLRHATHQQNSFNQSARPGTSKFKGVSFETASNSWRAYITTGGRREYLGRHKTEIEAATAYNTAAKERFGEYARINHVD